MIEKYEYDENETMYVGIVLYFAEKNTLPKNKDVVKKAIEIAEKTLKSKEYFSYWISPKKRFNQLKKEVEYLKNIYNTMD